MTKEELINLYSDLKGLYANLKPVIINGKESYIESIGVTCGWLNRITVNFTICGGVGFELNKNSNIIITSTKDGKPILSIS